jgi:hypothetical protein
MKEMTEILKNSSVYFTKEGKMRTENFLDSEGEAEVTIELDETVKQCSLTLFAYAGNTAFDPEDSYNIRLWSGMVTENGTKTYPFRKECLPLKAGFKLVACINLPVGEDTYRWLISQPVEVVDKDGNGFSDYEYPDAWIEETSLTAGMDKLHISLTGDERLFAAAKEGKISITCSVAQYPDGDTFDFEGEGQIPLANRIKATEGFSGKEIPLNEPLKKGYRVRAVVYWSQSVELFLAKGNDYEEAFKRPDDSILVE